jgi:altered-inheritance-of-mitochondria protein 13
LRREEEHVQVEIERALEKENLNKERAMAGDTSEGDGSAAGDVKSSVALQGDLEEIHEKISKYQSRKELAEYPEVKNYGDVVVECYRCAQTALETSCHPDMIQPEPDQAS